MLITAEQKNSRQSAQKVRLVSQSVKGLSLTQALLQLSVSDKKASVVVMKVMKQAIANATNNLGFKPEDLLLQEIIVNKGPTYRRFRAASRGRAHSIQKQTCHVRVVLKTVSDEVKPVAKKETKKEKAPPATVRSEVPVTERLEKNEKPVIEKKSAMKNANVSMSTKKTVNRTTSK